MNIERAFFMRILLSLVASLLPVTPALGQTDEAEKNSGRALLSEAIDAMGGMEKMRGWSTRIEKGTLRTNFPGWGHLTANTARYVMKPHRAKIDNDFSAYDHPFYFTYYTSGGEAWQVVNLEVRQSPEITTRMKEYLEKADGLAYYLAAADTFFLPGPVPADSLLPEKMFERVGCTAGGDTVLFDLDRETHLLLRQIEKKEGRDLIFDDFREAGGLRIPFHVTIYRGGEKAEELLWDSVTFDERIDPALFEESRPQHTEADSTS
jgi:hypothetical protein